jgi:hypothetical protein
VVISPCNSEIISVDALVIISLDPFKCRAFKAVYCGLLELVKKKLAKYGKPEAAKPAEFG